MSFDTFDRNDSSDCTDSSDKGILVACSKFAQYFSDPAQHIFRLAQYTQVFSVCKLYEPDLSFYENYLNILLDQQRNFSRRVSPAQSLPSIFPTLPSILKYSVNAEPGLSFYENYPLNNCSLNLEKKVLIVNLKKNFNIIKHYKRKHLSAPVLTV